MTSRKRKLRWAVATLTLMVAAALCHVWIRLTAVQLAYDIANETRNLETLEEGSRRLKAKIAHLKNPARLEKIARERLGMVPLDPATIRIVRASTVSRGDRARPAEIAAARSGAGRP